MRIGALTLGALTGYGNQSKLQGMADARLLEELDFRAHNPIYFKCVPRQLSRPPAYIPAPLASLQASRGVTVRTPLRCVPQGFCWPLRRDHRHGRSHLRGIHLPEGHGWPPLSAARRERTGRGVAPIVTQQTVRFVGSAECAPLCTLITHNQSATERCGRNAHRFCTKHRPVKFWGRKASSSALTLSFTFNPEGGPGAARAHAWLRWRS